MADTLGTNTTGYSYPGATYNRKGVATIWDSYVMQEVYDKLMLKQFIGGEGSNLPIIRKQDLSKSSKGDTIRLYLEGILTGFGKWGNTTLEDSEEAQTQYFQDVFINQLRHAMKDDGELSRQRDKYNINSRFSKQLARWYREQMERYIFNAFYYLYAPHLVGDTTIGGLGQNSEGIVPARYWYCADSANNSITYSSTAATHITNIQAAEQQLSDVDTDYFGPELLEGVASLLKVNNIPQVQLKGWSGWIGIIHPYQTAQLRVNEKWFDANIQAMPIGDDKNPVFTGAIGMDAVGKWGNILLFESNLIHDGNQSYYTDKISTAGGNATVEIDSNMSNVRRALFLGAEAMSFVEAVPPHIIKKGDFDYNNKEGVAISGIFGAMRTRMVTDDSNATVYDKGTMVVSTYSPATSI